MELVLGFKEIVEKACRGERRAFSALHERYAPRKPARPRRPCCSSIAERVIVTVSELWAGMVPVNANSLLAKDGPVCRLGSW